jgi:spoIIIJ-associated protein
MAWRSIPVARARAAIRRARSDRIEGRDSGRIIGKKGQVLAAIQHVVNRVVNRPGLDRRTSSSTPRYRQRREDTLATMAQRLGKKALEEGKIITFNR